MQPRSRRAARFAKVMWSALLVFPTSGIASAATGGGNDESSDSRTLSDSTTSSTASTASVADLQNDWRRMPVRALAALGVDAVVVNSYADAAEALENWAFDLV